MPQRRMLSTKIWINDQFCSLSMSERLLYIGTITLGDDDGRLKGDALFLKSQIFPYNEKIGTKKVAKMRDKICETGLFSVYGSKERLYISHPNWLDYQTLRNDRYKLSKFPPPPVDTLSPSVNQMSAQHNETKQNIIEQNDNKTKDDSIFMNNENFRESVNRGIKETGANFEV